MSRPDEPLHTVQGSILRETEKAILFRVDCVNKIARAKPASIWFPLSQVASITHAPQSVPEQDLEASDDEVDPPELDELKVKQWIMQAKGLI